ncbi:Hypothetical_protein [Hexamita inflata]|uniref:Hypothetical_protein n=1 Tax=Hexamita inflata TaxID=28002 RepID=A0AA86NII8_9EUKA|nr:Hypothetical protein HINF_LOCUS7490 [Hexamita inflata]CAI9977507.1 Hypothetical protein HINF_LOCUS65152 [Hexamita inflata]
MQNYDCNANNVNYGVHQVPVKDTLGPLSVFNKPLIARVISFISLCFLAVGVALVVIFITRENNFGYLAGGMACLFFGLIFMGVSISACCMVRSFTYIMMPCCISESERQRLRLLAEARTPMLNIMGVTTNAVNKQQTQVTNQQHISQYSYSQTQVQPKTVIQNPLQGVQQFGYQQNNVINQLNVVQPYMSAPIQAPVTINAPAELEILPVM